MSPSEPLRYYVTTVLYADAGTICRGEGGKGTGAIRRRIFFFFSTKDLTRPARRTPARWAPLHTTLYHGPLHDGPLPLSGGADDLYGKALRRALIVVHWLPPEKVRRRRHERWLRRGLSRRGLIPPARAAERALDCRTAVDAKASAGRRRRRLEDVAGGGHRLSVRGHLHRDRLAHGPHRSALDLLHLPVKKADDPIKTTHTAAATDV